MWITIFPQETLRNYIFCWSRAKVWPKLCCGKLSEFVRICRRMFNIPRIRFRYIVPTKLRLLMTPEWRLCKEIRQGWIGIALFSTFPLLSGWCTFRGILSNGKENLTEHKMKSLEKVTVLHHLLGLWLNTWEFYCSTTVLPRSITKTPLVCVL